MYRYVCVQLFVNPCEFICVCEYMFACKYVFVQCVWVCVCQAEKWEMKFET